MKTVEIAPGIEVVTELDISHIETEDETPVDNLFSERQQRLLVNALYTGWKPKNGKPFIAMSNVGLFYGLHHPPVVPDMLLSLGVTPPPEVWEKRHRSYFIWEYGKPPELVVEVVPNLKGGELSDKLELYASIGIKYYVVFDPSEQYGASTLRSFVLHGDEYQQLEQHVYPSIGLGLQLWRGEYEGLDMEWIRWVDEHGTFTPLPQESIEQERFRANEAESRAEKLAAKLRALGIDPDAV